MDSPYFDGCYFDTAYFDAAPCVVVVPTGGTKQGGRVRRPIVDVAPEPREDDDEVFLVAIS